MATDATGAPTPLGIPKYNTSADAPSGLGFNAAMDVLDTLIAAKVGKPSGIASGEVPVWNGSAFVRSSATNIGPASLGSGTPDATKFLRGDGSWQATTPGLYRKTTAKQVVNTVVETDLLNGEVTVSAGAMGSSGLLRLTAFGDWNQNSGAATDVPRFKLKLGATTLIDTSVTSANVCSAGNQRNGWKIEAEILNLGATNAQWINFRVLAAMLGLSTVGSATWATGAGRLAPVLDASAPNAVLFMGEGGNSTAVDTTVANALVLSVINPAASVGLDVTLKGAVVELI